MELKSITNPYFSNLKAVIKSCIGDFMGDKNIISDMQNASYDKDNGVYVYPSSSPNNLEVIKLDDLTKYRKNLQSLSGYFDELPAVDAVCIDRNNEWYFIEFKNSDIDNKRSSIRKKMFTSIWYIFFIYSKGGANFSQMFNGDITKFAREHINYVIVGSYSKNTQYITNIQAYESISRHYTPPDFEQFIGYYFKNVYMLTELEIRNFIKDFKS